MKAFGIQDIEQSFQAAIVDRGRQYYKKGKVLDVWRDPLGDLHGKVDGSDYDPYEVDLLIASGKRRTKLTSECTCPYGDQCKHGAAIAFYALEHDLRTEKISRIDLFDDEEVEEDEDEEEEPPFAIADAPPVPAEVPVPLELRDWLNHIRGAVADIHAFDPEAKQRVFYRLQSKAVTHGVEVLSVVPVNRNFLKSGALGSITEMKHGSIASSQRPKHWTRFDAALLSDINANAQRPDWNRAEYRLDGMHGERLLREILSTGRAIWGDGEPLTLGAPRRGTLVWEEDPKKGVSTPTLKLEGKGKVFAASAPWYVDFSLRECGPVECGLPSALALTLIRRGAISAEHLGVVRREMEALGLPESVLPNETRKVVVRAPNPTPVLSIDFETCTQRLHYWTAPAPSAPVAFAKLTFEYEGIRALVDGSDVRVNQGDELLILRRNAAAERNAERALMDWGWRESNYTGWEIPKGRGTSLCIVPPDAYRLADPIERVGQFVEKVVPILREAGWKVTVDQTHRFVPESEVEWDVELEEGSGIDWFQFKLGIRVEGEPFDLRSILAQALRDKNATAGEVYVFGLNGRVIRLDRRRLNAIVQPLVELFGGVTEWPEDLRLPKAALAEVGKVEEIAAAENVAWRTTDELRRLNDRLKAFDRLEPLAEPEGFKGELRGYQREGLAWLQFLREYGFGGILADDMGLGKTVQILAHIQTEKTAGRMDRPCLIVAPTSTMPNWRRECARFAPDLRVLTLQGGRRADLFGEIGECDIALTTYPLLARDRAHLMEQGYHLLVLDEAQNIKNPATAAAKAARELDARHRICLSGTPVENHLGELWSLFHFLMPGFLGTDAEFRKKFRGPIEKMQDVPARERLARRIRPFMLRRTKAQVVQELPAKTEIVETVEFGDPQRDLYESLRVVMDEQVRKLIADQGFDKSRIQVLDALLKLRQVCCDPRLVKIPSAQAVKESAKLDHLMEMLGTLIEGGRRVLVFSQFTSMLDLIEDRLREAKIEWVRISGDTVDRDTPVQRFQKGEVPLFLISLKAGGTGLNLTTADTVVLYDPWWNPAVENQAVDRAHRIGQKKAVIVYKMVASGTIEEKMLEMQARKGDIARSILTDDAEGIRTLTADDLRWMLSKQ
ncbi:MAG: SNF2-related protein [Fimbriimonas sp.]